MRQPPSVETAILLLLVAVVAAFWCLATIPAATPAVQARLAALALAGFVAGLAPALLWRGDVVPAAVLGYGLGVVLTVLAGAVLAGELGWGRAVLLLVSGGGGLAAFGLAVWRMVRGREPVEFGSDWGGLGHGPGGWRMSAPAALLLCALVFLALAAGVVATAAGR